jgi:hypothetical protein
MLEIEGGVSWKDGNDNNRHVSTRVVSPQAATLMTRPLGTRRVGRRPLQAYGCWRLKADTESWIKLEEHNKTPRCCVIQVTKRHCILALVGQGGSERGNNGPCYGTEWRRHAYAKHGSGGQ